MKDKKKHLLKCLSLINVDSSIINIDFKTQNIFLSLENLVKKISKSFFIKKPFKFEINYFESFKKNISNLKNALSINEYNVIISNLKQQKELGYLNELDPEMDKNTFLINKHKIFNDFLNELKKSYEDFYRLYKVSNDFQLKTGENNLYIGYGFISGNLSSDKKINTYLFNRPIKMQINDIGIQVQVSSKIIVNKNAILTLLNNFQVDEIDVEYKQKFWRIKSLIKYLKKILRYDVSLIKNIPDIEKLINHNDIIKVLDVYGLVFYDLSENKLVEESRSLLSKDIKLLHTTLEHDNEYYKELEIKSNPLIQVNTQLNLFQKFALRSAINENTIIYGPPGTGKSETITNIVANILVNRKTLAMCCQQQAAISVVYERLKNLKDFVLHLTSYDDKNLFYEQIKSMSSIVGECLFSDESEIKIELKELHDHERTKDYDRLNHKFLSDINDYIEFCKLKDSNGTDYKGFLLAKENVDNFISNNLEKIKNMYNTYSESYYKLQNEIEFISKVSEFNIFLNKYNLTDASLNKLLEYKKNFLEFLTTNNIIFNSKFNYVDVKEKVSKLRKFLKDNFLINDNNFNIQYKKNVRLLLDNFKILKEVETKLSSLKKDERNKEINKLIKNIHEHGSFLFKVKKTLSPAKKNIIISNYFSSSSASTFYNIFSTGRYKENSEHKELKKQFFECVNLMNNITLLDDNSYLFELLKFDEQYLDPIVVFFYYNPECFTEQFIELFNKEIIKFPKPVMVTFYQTKLNKIDHFFSIITDYKYEVLDKYPAASSLDMDIKIRQYLKDNNDYINKMNLAIYDFFKSNVRQNVLKQSKSVKEKMLRMFKLASNEIQYPKIKDFIIEYYNELKILYNAWLLRPELISDLVPLKPNQFDVVVFDEASQVILEKAYPILYRAKKAVITGDSKQLQPQISPYVYNEFQSRMRYSNSISLDDAFSLLDRTKTTFWNSYHLRNHYRSVDYRLIDYSNLNFYDNNLIYLTQNKNTIIPFQIVDVDDGECIENINRREASLIITELRDITDDEERSEIFKKILVICFTKEQAKFIKQLVYNQPVTNQGLIRLIKNKRLIINDYENIQGEEGDLSIISFVFDTNTKDLGALSTYQADNFINVSITRSKKQNIVYKSVNYKQIKNVWDESKSTCAKYVNYLDKLKEQIKNHKFDVFFDDSKDNAFINEVYIYLAKYFKEKNLNYKIVKELKIGSFTIDIAIYENSREDIKLCLMLNDFKKHLTLDEFLLDLDIYNLFIARGYTPMWILYTQWASNKELIVHKINEILMDKQ